MRHKVALTGGTILAAMSLSVGLFLASCATEQYANAPAEIVDDCRREVALLRDTDASPFPDDLQDSAPEPGPDPVEDARRAQEVSGGVSLVEWPEDALMFRCLQSRGIVLTPDQAATLAEWDDTLDDDGARSQD